MRRLIAATIAALALTSCADAPVIWNRAGATQQDFNVDKYACARDAIALGGTVYVGFGVTQRTVDENVFRHCMVARGWTASRG